MIQRLITQKQAGQKMWHLDIVEVSGNGHTIAILTNKPCIISAYMCIEHVNAKLTPCVRSRVGHEQAKHVLNHSQSESCPLLVAKEPLGHRMGEMYL